MENYEDVIENAIEWIDELAQNNYKQDKGAMQTNKGFCCLGVARELMEPTDSFLFKTIYRLSYEETKHYGLLPRGVSCCMEMNDNDGLTFPEIAAALVKKPHFFFKSAVAEGIQEHYYETKGTNK
jgi:hypothetical protein